MSISDMQNSKEKLPQTDLSFSEMMALQMELWEKDREKWPYDKEFSLDDGEDRGEHSRFEEERRERVMGDAEVRAAFVEELSDVLMYYIGCHGRGDIPSLCKKACTEYGAGFLGGISQPTPLLLAIQPKM